MTLFALAVYLAAQFALGYYISRRIKTEEDYLIGGRSLGMGLATFSIFATWFGAETCIGASGRVYLDGLSGGTHDPFGYALCILFMGLFIAVPIWKLKLTTLGDLFRIRYGSVVEKTASIIMIPTSLLWAGAQIRAFGQILAAMSGTNVDLMITLAAVFIIAYTYLGGFLADAWTDLIQGGALVLGLVTLFLFMLFSDGPSLLQAIPRERLSMKVPGLSIMDLVESWSVPVLGSLVAAELVTRAIASKTARIARRASIAAFAGYILLGLIPVFIGLVGPLAITNLEHAEQILPLMAQKYLPHFLYILLLGALLSAILSTVDSALLTCGSLTSHNIVVPFLLQKNFEVSDATKLQLARRSVVFFGVISCLLALSADGVYHLVAEASAFGSSGLVVVVIFALYSQFGNEYSAMLSLVGGVISYVLFAHILVVPHPFVLSLSTALLLYLLGGFRLSRIS
ncbi:MAG: sodium:solute symporter family protein [Saprospiraceae bacterium]|nr:sodium:solute symporter family protein [Saprospiraceae bacterium]